MRRGLDIAIGRNLRRLREARCLSHSDLAALTAVSEKDLVIFEEGDARVAPHILYDLAVSLGVPVSAFFEGADMGTGSEAEPPERRVH